ARVAAPVAPATRKGSWMRSVNPLPMPRSTMPGAVLGEPDSDMSGRPTQPASLCMVSGSGKLRTSSVLSSKALGWFPTTRSCSGALEPTELETTTGWVPIRNGARGVDRIVVGDVSVKFTGCPPTVTLVTLLMSVPVSSTCGGPHDGTVSGAIAVRVGATGLPRQVRELRCATMRDTEDGANEPRLPPQPPSPEHMMLHVLCESQCGAFQLCPVSCATRPTSVARLPA